MSMMHETFAWELEPGIMLRGDVRVYADGERKPVIVLIHGFKGFKDWGMFPYVAQRLAGQEYAVVTFNFSHNGVGAGGTEFDELDKFARNTHTLELRDLGVVIGAIQDGRMPLSQEMDADRVMLVGHSRGGGDCVLYAAEYPEDVKGIVSWNGIADCNLFSDEFREQVLEDGVGYVANARTKQQMPIAASFFEDLTLNQERYHIVKRAASLQMPALFVQGDADTPRLVEGYHRLQEEAPQHRYVLLLEVDHTFGTKHPWVGTTLALEKAIVLTRGFAAGLFERERIGLEMD
ncbi:alpha/beta hydrolase family protein [Paenibacillus cellulosilyticus]|uniref:Alpha/beta hydrolase family protein n=1 Tax=Paenibacillus cellulosilyticus TaxID=375489 RepID=A0A2V2YS23_9BACL|nr:alpha/beta fold hydrolase [Paenibacillus cellulosilyticus]PWV97382.1 alpha/beta hydrolase family protein [Paenibacillus cellulosilyticus]QKS48574.1 alpha/beta fold hydrolase [Paenibacillus cellulosilyticus]